MKKTTKLVHLIILISIIFFGFSASSTVHAQAPTDIDEKIIGNAKLITYKTGLADSPTKELLFDGPNGIIVPTGNTSVDNMILFFHDTDNPDPEEMCEDLGLCAKIDAIIAKNPVILVPQGNSSTGSKTLDISVINEYLIEVVHILNFKGITVPNEFNLTLAGHGQGGTTTVFNVLKQNMEVSQTLIFDGCTFDRCSSIVQLNNTGTVSIYFSTTQTQAINAYQTKPDKTLLYRLTNSTQEIPKLCINEHLLTDLCENNAVVVDNDTLQQKEFTNIGNTPIGKMCESETDCAMTGAADGGPGVSITSQYKCDQRNETPKVCTCNTALQCAETYGGSADDWECNSGNIKSYYLNFCKNKLAPDAYSEVYPWRKPPAPAEEAPTKTPPKFTKPALLVLGAICNLSDVNFVPGQVSNIPWISECIVGIYKKMLILGVIFAILFIVVGGVQYIVSAGNTGNVSKAKETMTKSVIGLLLLICSYIILYTVNPEITSLKSAQIEIIQGVELKDIPEYEEGPDFPSGKELPEPSDLPTTVKPVVGPATYKNNNYVYGIVKDVTCLNSYFFPNGISMGDRITSSTTKISILGLDKFWERSTPELSTHDDKETIERVNRAKKSSKGYVVTVHKQAVAAWEAFSNDLINSTDPEIKGYMQYIWDRAAGKVPSLSGTFKPNDIAQSNLGCGIGVQRKTCSTTKAPLKTVYADPHLTGQAIDIMTLSNNDNKTSQSPSSKGGEAANVCNRYKDTLEKMKNGTYGEYFKTDPYVLYERMDKIIAGCLAGKNAAWSIPDGMIDLAVKHKFYWAGWAWADPFRADGMHFEYYGPCFGLKNETPRPQ